MSEPKTLPLVSGRITIDPSDHEVQAILGWPCFRCGPIAHIFQAAGYPIPKHAEEEQAHVLLWLLGLRRDHGDAWMRAGNEQLKALQAEIQQQAVQPPAP